MNEASSPSHTELNEGCPVIDGKAFTVTEEVVALHPVAVFVKVNAAEPAVTPVTTPALVTAALALLLIQVPPVVGDKVIVEPMHT